ncbi:MAG: LamG domain-containing protein [Bacteroidota bacterium]|nr:LamG domain-containing protein [Bacteroidota bacterium]
MVKKIYLFISTVSLFFLFTNEKLSAQMFWNQACTFAGSNSSYVAVRNSATLNITSSFTLEAWVLPTNVATPSFQIILQKRAGNSDGYTLYLNNGRVAIRTNAITRLVGNILIPNNQWSHIAGTYSASTNTFRTYVNGGLDSTAVIAAAAPVTNTDSVWIGKGSNDPFAGKMDEVRIWNSVLTTTEFRYYRKTTLGTNSGLLSSLVMSMTFQDNDASGGYFSLSDWSGNGNSGINRGVIAYDQSNRPSTTININDCVEFDGTNDYMASPDNASISATAQLTLEAWIYPRSSANAVLIHKGAPSGGAGTNYRLSIINRALSAVINGSFNFNDTDTLQVNCWTHVAFTYNALTGQYTFYINGERRNGGTNNQGNIINGTDSLYIGGTLNLLDFDGFIDEVKITPDVKFDEAINEAMFRSTDAFNGSEVVYNLDGYLTTNTFAGSSLFFRNTANFAHCGGVLGKPQSPMDRSDDQNFSDGFLLKTSGKSIPPSSGSNFFTDTLEVLRTGVVADVNVFVGLNHFAVDQLQITLYSPNGDFVQLFDQNSLTGNGQHLTTIFDDQADSSLVNNRYVSFGPTIKALNSINLALSGSPIAGKWILLVRDLGGTSSDTGKLYGWGVQINNAASKQYLFNTTALIQGFYNPLTNTMVRDTLRYYFRNTQLPLYNIIDSGKAYVTVNGFAQLNLLNVSAGSGIYYLHLKHRNSIQTWSSTTLTLDPLTFQGQYDFTDAASKAFGDNMIQVDNAPVKFAIYNGDVNQDRSVDLTDLTLIENDAINFASGYIVTDLNGDNAADIADLAIADNNAFNFVQAILPPFAPEIIESNIKNNFTDPHLSY